MQSAVTQKPVQEKNNSSAVVQATEKKSESTNELGAEACMPVFMQRAPASFGAAPPDIQCLCDACEEELIADSAQVQPKLSVGAPNDEYEQEADQVADTVMRMPDISAGGAGDELPNSDSIRRKTNTPFYLQRMCAECEEELDTMESQVQAKHASGASGQAGNQVANTIKSPVVGAALSKNIKSRVEPVIGQDLSHVRVHQNEGAQQAATSINAKAFTHQNHIYLGKGESDQDMSLMAHEATHVVQQGSGNLAPAIQKRPVDFQVRGRHPDTASFSKITFFDYASSSLHLQERSKVDAMALPADRDLELRGFASEEGDTTANSALIGRRINSVKNRLVNEGHEPGKISETPRLSDGANQIDYRRWRSVEMVETGAPATTPECATEPEFEVPCPVAKLSRIQTGINRSRDMITTSITRIGNPAGFPHTQTLLHRLFTGAATADVITGLSTIRTHLSTYSANTPQCATNCHSDCEGTLAYNNPEVTPDAMVVCPGFHTSGDADYAAVTLLHEASHAAPGMQSSDHAYEWDRLLDQLNATESLDNADSYTMLVYLIHHPGARSIGPATDDTTNITDAGELAQIEPAIARVGQWVSLTSSETQSLYSEIRDARGAGAWTNSWYEDVMTLAAHHYPLTSPPTTPVMRDQENVAAIFDRFSTMSNAMGQVLDIRKRNGSVADWQAGPGAIVRVGPSFFGRSLVEQIEILLAALTRATPNISTAYHSKYVGYTKDIRTKNSLGP